MTVGLANGTPPPGAPPGAALANNAIVGGTGAYLGARGYVGQGTATVAPRRASMTEDPVNRRTNGGGKTRYVLEVIPMTQPQIMVGSSGPAVFHSDFSPVTPAKPAKAGEILVLLASGLGPTLPGVAPGQPFTADPLQVVNSPMQVIVNAKAGDALYAGGYPGVTDTYQVNFLVPDSTPTGQVSVQLSAAWIPGASVNIPIQ